LNFSAGIDQSAADLLGPYHSPFSPAATNEDQLARDLGVTGSVLASVLTGRPAGAAKSLGANPFRGKSAKEIAEMLETKGYVPRGPDPAAGRGTYVNPQTGRGYHIDANHPPPKGPHVGVHRPRDLRDTLPPRDYPLEGP
jgi:hypothetical protein